MPKYVKLLTLYRHTELSLWTSHYPCKTMVFTALHGMQTRYSDENSVCLSVCLSVSPAVCPSVCHTRELWQNGRKICPDLCNIWKDI